MITIILLLTFTGFYTCYATTKRQKVPINLKIETWCLKKSTQANAIGSILIFIACALSIYKFGWGSGIFTYLIFLMTVASLIILLQPLHLITYKTISLTLLLIFLMEFSFF
ncbi:hypothetical protein SAMN04488010_1599 [Maribacter stanieri]|uniref:Uncharacterized protein n=1 Tax=Maribacter stanieri TaxID=440514 RepID=A0A1I6IFB0_9FLAO|nr:hypothetical protein SAMN04488010_1599 [Maribacter stanieri]